jgi:hypothetical protein
MPDTADAGPALRAAALLASASMTAGSLLAAYCAASPDVPPDRQAIMVTLSAPGDDGETTITVIVRPRHPATARRNAGRRGRKERA